MMRFKAWLSDIKWRQCCSVLVVGCFILPVFCGCESKGFDKSDTSYLHISHMRKEDRSINRLMDGVENLDWSYFDVVMLGGDLLTHSTQDSATINYLDSVFDFSNPDLLWTFGNHDYYFHPDWISDISGRPTFYQYHKNNIDFLVFDTQADGCNTRAEQAELLEQAIVNRAPDTRHMILLHHKLIWLLDEGDLESQVDSVANGGIGVCLYCIHRNNFYEFVYPRLVELQEEGVQVICVAGDIGKKTNRFEHRTKEGVYFLASGLQDGAEENLVLVFDHDTLKNDLSWRYVRLEELPLKTN